VLAARFAGSYTMAFSGGRDPTTSPFGHGFGFATIKKDGIVRFKGVLADGSPIARKIPTTANGQWPVHSRLSHGRGLLLGWLGLEPADTNLVRGLLLWTKSSGGVEPFYASGFTNEVTVIGSRYLPYDDGNRAPTFSDATVILEGGNLAASLTNFVVRRS